MSELEVDGKYPHSSITCSLPRILLDVREFALIPIL